MVLPIELGPDPVVYGLSLAAITIFFMKLGLNDWQWPSFIPDEAEDPAKVSFYRPIKYTAFWAMQLFTFLLHGAILAGLIYMYSETLRNSKDNVILVLSAIALGLNLSDFFFKSYFGMYFTESDILRQSVYNNVIKGNVYNIDKKVENQEISLYWFKWGMFIVQTLGFVAFFTTSFAYAWVGDMADMSSNSRSLLTTSGIVIILIFGFAMAALYRRHSLTAKTTERLLMTAGIKLTLSPLKVDSKVYHVPVQVPGIAEPLQHSDPDTPLLLAAAAKAGQNLKQGITATNWKVVKHGQDNYLVSPQVFDAHQELMKTTCGNLSLNNTSHTGGHANFVESLHQMSHGLHSGLSGRQIMDGFKNSLKGHKIGFSAADYPAYSLIFRHVAGFGKGMGVFFNTHPWMPIVSVLYMFGFYLIMLQNAMSALLAVSICHIPALVMCFFGIVQQWWELFRWNFLVGWSLINLVVYVIPVQTARYIRDEASWNITNFPVQEFVYYTTADNSTTVLGYNGFATTMSLAVFVGVFSIFLANMTSVNGGALKDDKPPATIVEGTVMQGEQMRLLSGNGDDNTRGLSKRSVRYLNN
jgi:hypothetical protein